MSFHTQSTVYNGEARPTPQRIASKIGQTHRFGSRQPLVSRSYTGNTDVFPCNNPTNPSYINPSSRLQSYHNWPGHIQATPEQLADAGFYYLDERDRCKCYYCNGGLQNWEFHDDPWFEHAKWFPQCEYLLQQKGLEYVASINTIFPNLQRPGEETHTTDEHELVPNSLFGEGDSNGDLGPLCTLTNTSEMVDNVSLQQHPALSNSVNVADIQHGSNQNSTGITERSEMDLAAEALQFGYGEDTINYVIQRKHNESRTSYSSLVELIEAIIKQEENEQDNARQVEEKMDIDKSPWSHSRSNIPRQVVADNTAPSHSRTLNPRRDCNIKSQLEIAMNESICKICSTRERSCVFTGCGHLCCCFECGQMTKQCPICGTRTVEIIKVFKT